MLPKALIWALGITVLTSLLFPAVSFGVAHGSVFGIFYLGGMVAVEHEWPGHESFVALFFYQLVYYVACALAVAAVVGMFRVRAERLRAERERTDAS
jgi:hypothetical protein